MICGPRVRISPSSAIFTSILGIGKPTVPHFIFCVRVTEITGEASVMPYPSIIISPKDAHALPVSAESRALEAMRERKKRKKNIMRCNRGKRSKRAFDIRDKILMSQHHAFRRARCAAGINDGNYIIGQSFLCFGFNIYCAFYRE